MSEGDSTLITSKHLKVVLDFEFYGIPESGVLFRIIEKPSRGRLDVSVWNQVKDNIFTLLDLKTNKVSF